jgi:hypothetical protein
MCTLGKTGSRPPWLCNHREEENSTWKKEKRERSATEETLITYLFICRYSLFVDLFWGVSPFFFKEINVFIFKVKINTFIRCINTIKIDPPSRGT